MAQEYRLGMEPYLQWRRPVEHEASRFEAELFEFWSSGKAGQALQQSLGAKGLKDLRRARRGMEHDTEDMARSDLLHHIFHTVPNPIFISTRTGAVYNVALARLFTKDEKQQLRFPVEVRVQGVEPLWAIVRNALRLSRKALVLPLGGSLFSVQTLLLPEHEATVVYLTPMKVRLPNMNPAARLVVALRFSGLHAKETAFILQWSHDKVNRLARQNGRHLKSLQTQLIKVTDV